MRRRARVQVPFSGWQRRLLLLHVHVVEGVHESRLIPGRRRRARTRAGQSAVQWMGRDDAGVPLQRRGPGRDGVGVP